MDYIANWITVQRAVDRSAIYWFRKTLQLKSTSEMIIRISAESRYRLFVNEKFLCEGPCKGTEYEKYFEEVIVGNDVLKPGENTIMVQVWNLPQETLASVIRTGKPGLWFHADIISGQEKYCLISDETWEYRLDKQVRFVPTEITLNLVAENQQVDYRITNGKWKPTKIWYQNRVDSVSNYGVTDLFVMKKRPIPLLEYEEECSPTIISSNCSFTETDEGLVIEVSNGYMEYDARNYLTARVFLDFWSNAGAKIKLIYAEAYYLKDDNGEWIKKERDDLSGVLIGDADFLTGNGEEIHYQPFWMKAFRFIRIEFENVEKLIIRRLAFLNCRYPLPVQNHFQCSDAEYNKMWEISVRTLRNCMREIYEDCPYYEQQQYSMDTALQSLYAFQLSNDYQLARKAIYDLGASQRPDGLLLANYPSMVHQIIPTFSFFWIYMLKNYLLYSGNIAFAKSQLGTLQKVLCYFGGKINEEGLLDAVGYWPFVDWAEGYQRGVPDGKVNIPLAAHNLMYACALQWSAEICRHCECVLAKEYQKRAEILNKRIVDEFYDVERGFFVQYEGADKLSEHEQIWAVLSGAVKGDEARALLIRAQQTPMSRASFSMGFFVLRAWEKVGLYEEYSESYAKWSQLLKLSCITWPESLHFPRSECHGWSSAIIYEMTAWILGIQPMEPGCRIVRITPHLEQLEWAQGALPTPYGMIYVRIERMGNDFQIQVDAPEEMEIVYDAKWKLVRRKNEMLEKSILDQEVCHHSGCYCSVFCMDGKEYHDEEWNI